MGSISRHFLTRVVVPAGCLVLLWGLLAGTAIAGPLTKLRWLADRPAPQQTRIELAMVAGAGLAVIVVAVLLMNAFSRRLAREISGLTVVIEENKRSAAAAAAAETGLRHGLRMILVSLAKRNQALLHRQLRIIDDLEQAASPSALADLFTLDHLTTRMRRNAESLTILSGAVPSRSWSGPVAVVDVIRAAAAEVEDYTRVTVISDAVEAVLASAVTDMIHLLAELIENATLCSPSSTRVEVRAERVANGLAIEIEDRGLGIPAEQLREINKQLASPPDFDMADPDRLGLFVTGKLAARHGVHVSLNPSPFLGIRAVVVLPEAILEVPAEEENESGTRARPFSGRLSKLNLRAADVLALAGAAPAEPEPATTTRNGLPRRLRPDSPQAQHTAAQPAAGPAPEEARSLAASLQNSWLRSRQADDTPDADSPDGEEEDADD